MEIKQWEKDNKRPIDESTDEDSNIIRNMLIKLDENKTVELLEDIRKKGQMEPGVISHDGIVINGNRRMAVLKELSRAEPTGKWDNLEVVRLESGVSDKDLWKIEAGLQLSKEKVAEYSPVNELLKIKQGKNRGLKIPEIAAALYGRSEYYVKDSLDRLKLIDDFLEFFGQSENYGLIKTFGLHEYFIDIQKNVINPWERFGIPTKERHDQLLYSFALLRASVLNRNSKEKIKGKSGITHLDFRNLGKIFMDAHAKGEFLKHLGKVKNIKDIGKLENDVIIEDFKSAVDELAMKEQRRQPSRLLERALKSIKNIRFTKAHKDNPLIYKSLMNLKKAVDSLIRKYDT